MRQIFSKLKCSKLQKPRFSALVMRIAAAICCLTVLSTCLLSGIYAKYSNYARSDDTARIAKFVSSAVQTSNTNSLSINTANGETLAEYSFSVTNFDGIGLSEVSQNYSVSVIFPTALPAGLSVTVDGLAASYISGNTYTFTSQNWYLGAGVGATNTHTLQFLAAGVAESFTASGIQVIVYFEQVD